MRGGYRENAGRKIGFSAIQAEKARELISSRLSEELTLILDMLIKQAKNGDIKATRELFDRAWGRPSQDISFPISLNQKIDGLEISIRK